MDSHTKLVGGDPAQARVGQALGRDHGVSGLFTPGPLTPVMRKKSSLKTGCWRQGPVFAHPQWHAPPGRMSRASAVTAAWHRQAGPRHFRNLFTPEGMTSMTANLKPTLRLLALASALLGLPIGAHATAAVSLTAAEALGSAAGPGTNVMDVNANGGDFFRSNSAGADSTFFHTYGTSGGVNYFGARVSGTGTFFGKTSATYTDSITNNTGVAQTVMFSFNVDSGNIGLSGSGDGYADLLLSLRFGSDVVARDHGRITYNSSVASCDSNVGAQDVGVLASYLSCDGGGNSASGNAGSYSASRLLGVGQTLNVTYDIVAEVSGTLSGTTTQFCNFGGRNNIGVTNADGVGGVPDMVAFVEFPRPSGCTFFNAIARSGDPAGFSPFAPGRFGLTPVAAVPEPGGLALVALALGGLVTVGRRRKAG